MNAIVKSPVIDLSQTSEADLRQIENEVLRRLAVRATQPRTETTAYDRHGSGHSKSSDEVAEKARPANRT